MATYNGYNVKIGATQIPNAIIKPGSYTHTPEKRIRSERTDANGIHHFKYFSTLRHRISFTIKAATKEQFDTIRTALASRNGVTVKFWDEDSNDYLTGTFEMKAPAFTQSFANTSTYYLDEIPIELIQH